MSGPKFQPPPYNKTREDAYLQRMRKPFVSLSALFLKPISTFHHVNWNVLSTFWQAIDNPKEIFLQKLSILQKYYLLC